MLCAIELTVEWSNITDNWMDGAATVQQHHGGPAASQRRWPYKRSGGDLLVPVRSALLWSCCGGSRKHRWALDRKPGCAPTSSSPKDLAERVRKGAVRPRSCSRGPTTTMAVDPGSRRRRLTTKTPTARRMGTRRHNTMARWRRQRRGGWEQRRNNTMRRGVSRVSNLVKYIIYNI